MKHIHLTQCDSTQIYLKNHLQNFLEQNEQQVLVSTSSQTQGVGRQGHAWIQFPHALAFSFIISPHPILSLTSLELGALMVTFFREQFDHALSLKWPNDLINPKGEKCGGIICHYDSSAHLIIAGIGLNLLPTHMPFLNSEAFEAMEGKENNLKLQPGSLLENENQLGPFPLSSLQSALPEHIYRFLLTHRLETQDLLAQWNQACFHQDKKVKVVESPDHIYEGIFRGLGEKGEALIESSSQGPLLKILSGSLFPYIEEEGVNSKKIIDHFEN